MHPILIQFGPLTLHTYGLFVALGFMAGIAVASCEARRTGQDPARVSDLCFLIIVTAIVGARLFYILTAPASFIRDPLEIFRVWNGGLVFYGGFVTSLAGALVFMKIKHMPVWRTADILVPALALGHGIGRIGCFFAGCCHGRTCDLPWAVTFIDPNSLAPTGIPLHPTQLYSAAANFALFGIIWMFRRKKRFDGQVFWLYAGIYGGMRFLLEMFRGDYRGETLMGTFSTSQTIGLILILVSAVMLFVLKPSTGQDAGAVRIGKRKAHARNRS